MHKMAPYQFFFPLGILNAILAVGIWIIFDLGWFQSAAMTIHSRLILGGFLWAFITGFLMTAVPRMTGTKAANQMELALALTLILGLTISSFITDQRFFYVGLTLLIFSLIIYAGRRLLKRSKPMPVFFSHVGIAMALALIGAQYHLMGQSFMGTHLLHLGAILVLVLGIGTRFFSFLSGLPSFFETDSSPTMRLIFHVTGVLTAVLLYLAGTGMSYAYLGLSALSLFYLFCVWKIQRSSPRPSALKVAMRIVAGVLPISLFMIWLQPEMYLAWFHVLFVACFGMITFSVATRVTLAHGSYSTDLEISSRALWLLVLCLTLGAFSRLVYGYSQGPWKIIFLNLAATLWIAAVICWCFTFWPKIFKPGPMAKPSC